MRLNEINKATVFLMTNFTVLFEYNVISFFKKSKFLWI